MTTIYYEDDADRELLERETIAVVGYGNQGRSWALNLRDSGCAVQVCVRADETRERAREDGFAVGPVEQAADASAVCILVPDDAIAGLGLVGGPDRLTVVASGYALAYGQFRPERRATSA